MRILASVEGLSPEPGGNEQTRVVRQQRYASLMMRTFVSHISGMGKKTIHLMCKERHVGLYERLGYSYVKPSSSDHGGMSWHEMVMTI
jgi:hypothetical protein